MMMDFPLTLTHFLERAGRLFPKKEIVTRTPEGTHRYTYADFHARTHRLAHALHSLGVKPGDRVGTLAWNHYRHLELYNAIPCYGAVLHTLNLRLAADQLAFIINHAEDQVIFADESLLPILDPIRDQIPCVRKIIVIGEEYEGLLAAAPAASYAWPRLDENAAAGMCYTSGTTGNPKGVVYSHRAIALHNYALAMADTLAFCERDTLLQIVPMFHANGWGKPYAAVMCGMKIVLPGAQPQPRDLATLIEKERCTVAGGVPTIWIGLLRLLEQERFDLSSVRLFIGAGSAIPRQLIADYESRHGIRLVQLWGMTETTPVATLSVMKSEMDAWPKEVRLTQRAKAGFAVAGVELRVMDADGNELPWDGKSAGELQVRGPWVTSGYYNDERSADAFADGWFRTGDVVTVDEEGSIQILDRTKDLVKSGGEWISSVDLENAIMAHPKVLEASVIAVPHEKWHERPLAVVALAPEHRGQVTREEILDFLTGKVAKWWLPDDVVFVDALPKTSVGKFNKRALRALYPEFPPLQS
ncbi:MAG: fatty-acid--CoA ligase [Bryobacterales bacterium]|nr:fatty-acid--CoA ligase [Bryobacterales bacterium]